MNYLSIFFHKKRGLAASFPPASVQFFEGFVFPFQSAEFLADALEPEAVLAGPLFFLQLLDFGSASL
jgi:hypothetical protein